MNDIVNTNKTIDMIEAVILVFTRIGEEEYKTIPHTKRFMAQDRLGDVLEWVKSIDETKSITDVYFNDKSQL